MARKTRFGGYDFSIEKNKEGIHVAIKHTPGHEHEQEEVFQMFDQFRKAARQSGVGTVEIMTHWVKNQLGLK
jgi:hypothetical protein